MDQSGIWKTRVTAEDGIGAIRSLDRGRGFSQREKVMKFLWKRKGDRLMDRGTTGLGNRTSEERIIGLFCAEIKRIGKIGCRSI
jgi:hypothetical protein